VRVACPTVKVYLEFKALQNLIKSVQNTHSGDLPDIKQKH
jgi:hypothetical protein